MSIAFETYKYIIFTRNTIRFCWNSVKIVFVKNFILKEKTVDIVFDFYLFVSVISKMALCCCIESCVRRTQDTHSWPDVFVVYNTLYNAEFHLTSYHDFIFHFIIHIELFRILSKCTRWTQLQYITFIVWNLLQYLGHRKSMCYRPTAVFFFLSVKPFIMFI